MEFLIWFYGQLDCWELCTFIPHTVFKNNSGFSLIKVSNIFVSSQISLGRRPFSGSVQCLTAISTSSVLNSVSARFVLITEMNTFSDLIIRF